MRVAYVGQYRVDRDSAGLQRVLGISAALAQSGHEVAVGGQGARATAVSPHYNVDIQGFGAGQNGSRLTRIATGAGVGQWLDSLPHTPDMVISYGGTGFFVGAVKRWARRGGVPRVVDSVEWYERASLAGGRYGPKAVDNEVSMRLRYPSHDGAIAISTLLEKHYRNAGTRHVLRVPPIADVEAVSAPSKGLDGPITLLYAGSPGAKDSLGTVVEALSRVDPVGNHMRLEVLGVSPDEAHGIPSMPVDLPASAAFLGRVPREQVLKALERAHYVPIIRRDERYAHAGFPTKLVEAMASGTAVIANRTSDIGDHLVHRQTGLLAQDDSLGAVVEALQSAMDGGQELAAEMGGQARRVALRDFDFRQHADALDEFVRLIVGGA